MPTARHVLTKYWVKSEMNCKWKYVSVGASWVVCDLCFSKERKGWERLSVIPGMIPRLLPRWQGKKRKAASLTDVKPAVAFLSSPLQLRGLFHGRVRLGLILSLPFGSFGICGLLLLGRFCFPFILFYLKPVFYHLEREKTFFFSKSGSEQARAFLRLGEFVVYFTQLLVYSSMRFPARRVGIPGWA